MTEKPRFNSIEEIIDWLNENMKYKFYYEDYKSSPKLLVNTRMNCSDRRGNE